MSYLRGVLLIQRVIKKKKNAIQEQLLMKACTKQWLDTKKVALSVVGVLSFQLVNITVCIVQTTGE